MSRRLGILLSMGLLITFSAVVGAAERTQVSDRAPGSAIEPAVISLGGQWDFTYTRSSVAEVPEIPPASAFDVKVLVPLLWDEQWDRLKKAKWWPDAEIASLLEGSAECLMGVGWYKRTIDASSDWEGRAVRLTIGRAVGTTHVWVNSKHIGSYDYGVYTPYCVDLTGHLVPGAENELVIAVDNKRPGAFAGGWAFIGPAGRASGLARPVTLHVAAGPGRISDVYVKPGVDLKEVVWQVELETPALKGSVPDSKLIWEVRRADNKTVMAQGVVDVPGFSQSRQVTWKARVEDIRPWSDRHPNLYWTNIRWVTDDATTWDVRDQRFGLRRWSYEGRKLMLNGCPIYLRGEFGAYYYPISGATPTSKQYWIEHVRRAKEIGMNYINYAARVCPLELLEAADELGMIMQCGDHMTVLEPYRDCAEEVWTPIVRWTRGHPSTCIYGFGGERNYYEGILEQYRRQYDLIKSLHPESLVMPQQAIRGIDYAFDAKGKTELTPEPFPHHAERLAKYAEACDLFGHYSSGALSYRYFETPWREMNKRFAIYDRPLSQHELFMGSHYANPENAKKYTGRVKPMVYLQLKDRLAEAGLLERWPIYHDRSSRLQGICKKYNVEKVRKCDGLTAYEFLGMMDMHFMLPEYGTGILDEFLERKPGDTVDGIRRYNNESVLLLDWSDHSINRSFWAEDDFQADVMASLYGESPLEQGQLTWTLKSEKGVLLAGGRELSGVPNGCVSILQKLKLTWPTVKRTTKANLSVSLAGSGYELANDWDFWIFPRAQAPKVVAAADKVCGGLLSDRYQALAPLSPDSAAKLHIVSEIGPEEKAHLAGGGDVLLLGTRPFSGYSRWTDFNPCWGGRAHGNVGFVINEHPVFDNLPNAGWADWLFFPILHGAPSVQFLDHLGMDEAFHPIIEVISNQGDVRRQAALFEMRIGPGRLMVSTCRFDASNPSCVALMDSILRYVQSDAFEPKDQLPVGLITELLLPPAPRVASNKIVCPGFESGGEVAVASAWRQYGRPYEIDSSTAHTGESSLKLTLPPADQAEGTDSHTGARAQSVSFQRSPKTLKLSAWTKAQDLKAPGGGGQFLIFVYITYKDGGRHTLRLHFESGTRDWEYSETIWKPEKEVASDDQRGAQLYVGLGRQVGTAWVDDLYFGEAPEAPAPDKTLPNVVWHRQTVRLDLDAEAKCRINDGPWVDAVGTQIATEGIHRILVKSPGKDLEVRHVGLDVTPPTIELQAEMEQLAGKYYASPETEFSVNASDRLSGVAAVEVSIDDKPYSAYQGAFRLPAGAHELEIRATDAAGNRGQLITGKAISGGNTNRIRVDVR